MLFRSAHGVGGVFEFTLFAAFVGGGAGGGLFLVLPGEEEGVEQRGGFADFGGEDDGRLVLPDELVGRARRGSREFCGRC